MEVSKTNTLSFYNDQGVLTISAKQYDTGRKFIFNIINDYELCDLTGYSVYMRMKKADKTEFQGEECCSIDGSKVIVDTSVGNGDQILSCSGMNLCELHLTDGDGKSVTTWNFIINVEARVHNGDGILSKDSWDIMYTIESKAPIVSPALTGIPTAPTASAGTNTTQIATTAFVQTALSEGISASNTLIFKGTLGTTGTITTLPTTYKIGWTYRVVTNGTYAGQVCEIGDLVIALVNREDTGNLDSDWCVTQTNVTVDDALNNTSTNPVQNKVVDSALGKKIGSNDSITFDDTTSTYSTLSAANTAAEASIGNIKTGTSIIDFLKNAKQSFSAIIQGLKILGTNVGAIQGITDSLTATSSNVALSAKGGNNLQGQINTLNSNLVKRNGSTSTINPVSDVNNFYSGIGLFSSSTANIPTADWWLIVSGGYDGTVVQTAYNLWNNSAPKTRYCAAGVWSEWVDIKPPHSIVYKNFTLYYKSDTEMYGEIEASGIPMSFTIHESSQTPYGAVSHTSMTQIGNKVMCSAYGSEFVPGHVLGVTIAFYQ